MDDGHDGVMDHGEVVILLQVHNQEHLIEHVQILHLHEVDHIVVEVLLLLKQETVLSMDDGVHGIHEAGEVVIVQLELKIEQIQEVVQILLQKMDDQVVVDHQQEL